MIISRTPFRLSFFGGGTDYPVFYREHGGGVLSTTINKYCYITCRHLPPFFDHKFRIRYSTREETQTVDEIKHPSVRECLKFLQVVDGVELVHTSDIPAMSGIGSSSAFTVGFLNALYALKGKMTSKRQLAYEAIHIEQEILGEHVGSQDQVAAAFGGFNHIRFSPNGTVEVHPVTISQERVDRLQECLMLCFTGFSRVANDIAVEQVRVTANRTRELEAMRQMVDEALAILNRDSGDLDDFGRLLHESWCLKRSLTTKITNDQIDSIYATARGAGAIGGKLCGAGGGGFMQLFVPPERQARVKEALKGLLIVPFRFESLGSHIVFYSQ
jgi:D-glycero-alpha-D-manno-heptose-7-phosphate kinase